MPTTYNSNITNPNPTSGAGRRVAISSFTNATPVVVQTVGVHSFNNNDSIEIEGTSGFIDGLWTITGGSTTTSFSLNGSVAPGLVGGSAGYAIDYEVLPAQQFPSDGDLVQAVGIAPPFEGIIDTIAWNYRNAGKLKLYNQLQGPLGGPLLNLTGWAETSLTAASWPTSGPRPMARSYVSLLRLAGFPGLGMAPIVGSKDFLDIHMTGNAALLGGTGSPPGVYLVPGFTQPVTGLPLVGIQSTSTNGSSTPVTVTTLVNHGRSTGDYVDLIDITGNMVPALQGVWQITVTAANTFTLNGSTTGASIPFISVLSGGTAGVVQPLITPSFGILTPPFNSMQFIPSTGSSPPTPFPFSIRHVLDVFHSGLATPGQIYIGLGAWRSVFPDTADPYLLSLANIVVNHYRPN